MTTALHWLEGCLAAGRKTFRNAANMGRISEGLRAAQGKVQLLQRGGQERRGPEVRQVRTVRSRWLGVNEKTDVKD